MHPWWEIDLGRPCVVERVVVWNRWDEPLDETQPNDRYRKRLFPCWLFLSTEPFPRTAPPQHLTDAHNTAHIRKRFTKVERSIELVLPFGTVARYIRLQSEGQKFLHVAEVEAFGLPQPKPRVGRVAHVSCGNQTTLVVCEAVHDKR